MEEKLSLIDLDPSGDVELVIFMPNRPQSHGKDGSTHSETEDLKMENSEDDETIPCQRIRCSSKHLTLASTYYRRMLTGNWAEAENLRTEGSVIMEIKHDGTDGHDTDAFIMILKIIHGRARQVPRTVDLETLANIAVLVDFYECHEVVEPFARNFLTVLEDFIPMEYTKNLMRWLMISSVFRSNDIFERATTVMRMKAQCPIDTFDFPIPGSVIGWVEESRKKAIGQIIGSLQDLIQRYTRGYNQCTFECNSVHLGALIKETQRLGLGFPAPEPPYLGYSVEIALEKLNVVQAPRLSTQYHVSQKPCSYDPDLKHLSAKMQRKMKRGLRLEDTCNT